MSGRVTKKTVLPKIEVPEAPAPAAPAAVVEEPKKEKAPRKPRAVKAVEEATKVVDEPDGHESDHEEIAEVEKPKAPRKPRAPKTQAPEKEPVVVVAPEPEPEPKVVEAAPEVAKPKARGRPKKVVDGEIPTHQMEAPAKANPKIKVVLDEEGNPTKRKKREPKLDADGNVIKRAPTEYNKFLAKTMAELKEEYKDYEVKPNQKELMAEVAAKWREIKGAA
jgi:hypothetical protein